MLVVTRKLGEKIVIGKGIVLSVVSLKGGQVRLAVEAPRDVRILRDELEKHACPAPAERKPADSAAPARKPVGPNAAGKQAKAPAPLAAAN